MKTRDLDLLGIRIDKGVDYAAFFSKFREKVGSGILNRSGHRLGLEVTDSKPNSFEV